MQVTQQSFTPCCEPLTQISTLLGKEVIVVWGGAVLNDGALDYRGLELEGPKSKVFSRRSNLALGLSDLSEVINTVRSRT